MDGPEVIHDGTLVLSLQSAPGAVGVATSLMKGFTGVDPL